MHDISVFLSSTSKDLTEERGAVESVIRRMEIPFVGMEYFGSDDATPLEVCLRRVRECSIYVGVVGFRYGSIPPNSLNSFTEAEYEVATNTGLVRLIYLKSRDSLIRPEDFEADIDNREKLDAFRNRLESAHMVSHFTSADDLATMVAADLYKFLVHRQERESLIEETDAFLMPRLIIKRAFMALLGATSHIAEMQALEEKGRLEREIAQMKALEFLDTYRFRFDGQFTVFDSNRNTIFHDYKHMIGRKFQFSDVDFEPIFGKFPAQSGVVILKWVDRLSSDFLLKNDGFYSSDHGEEWLRMNFAYTSYVSHWDWNVIVEAHNEVHGLDIETAYMIREKLRKKGWLVRG